MRAYSTTIYGTFKPAIYGMSDDDQRRPGNGPSPRKDCTVAESYYAARSRRDPEWRLRAIAAAAERYRRAKDTDPDRVLAYSGAYRARLRESSLTFPELHRRVGGDPELLRIVLADEVRRGTVERVQRRYRLNGGLPDDVKLALRDLGLSP